MEILKEFLAICILVSTAYGIYLSSEIKKGRRIKDIFFSFCKGVVFYTLAGLAGTVIVIAALRVFALILHILISPFYYA